MQHLWLQRVLKICLFLQTCKHRTVKALQHWLLFITSEMSKVLKVLFSLPGMHQGQRPQGYSQVQGQWDLVQPHLLKKGRPWLPHQRYVMPGTRVLGRFWNLYDVFQLCQSNRNLITTLSNQPKKKILLALDLKKSHSPFPTQL